MDNESLKIIIQGLIATYGINGTKEYIATGDYSLGLKVYVLTIIESWYSEEKKDVFVLGSDMEDSWSSQPKWNFNYAS